MGRCTCGFGLVGSRPELRPEVMQVNDVYNFAEKRKRGYSESASVRQPAMDNFNVYIHKETFSFRRFVYKDIYSSTRFRCKDVICFETDIVVSCKEIVKMTNKLQGKRMNTPMFNGG